MELVAIVCVPLAIYVFAYTLSSEVKEARRMFLGVSWIPFILLMTDLLCYKVSPVLRLFLFLLSGLFGVTGLMLLKRSKQNAAPMLAIFIFTDFAFFPSVYYGHLMYEFLKVK